LGNWKVQLGSQENLVFNDTRRETGKDVLRPIFLRFLARDGEIVRERIRVVDPEGKPRYTDTFLVIRLKDEWGEVTMLFEHWLNLERLEFPPTARVDRFLLFLKTRFFSFFAFLGRCVRRGA